MMRFLRVMLLLALLGGVAAFAGWHWLQDELVVEGPLADDTIVDIRQGSSLRAIAQQLVQADVVKHDWLMYYWGRYRGFDRDIKAGEYRFPAGISVQETLTLLRSGSNVQYLFTIVEGWTVSEMLRALLLHEKIEHTLQSSTAVDLARELELPETNAEGLFLPETYSYRTGESDRAVLMRANASLHDTLQRLWDDRAEKLPLETPYEALILASLIERETGVVEERPRIAGVFTSRLKQGMRLQTDPAVIYGIGEAYDGNITRKHLQTPTPYNTYTIAALPPTPIALSGAAAIAAATRPDETGELFFVARGDGSHKFSRTFEEHNAAVKEFQLKRRSDYRSSPGPTR